MKYATLDQVLSWHPCYPNEQVEAWLKVRPLWTAMDFLTHPDPTGGKVITGRDRLWAAFRPQMLDDRMGRFVACRMVRRVVAEASPGGRMSDAAWTLLELADRADEARLDGLRWAADAGAMAKVDALAATASLGRWWDVPRRLHHLLRREGPGYDRPTWDRLAVYATEALESVWPGGDMIPTRRNRRWNFNMMERVRLEMERKGTLPGQAVL